MGYCGTKDIETLQKDGKMVMITGSGLKESHPHDVIITQKLQLFTIILRNFKIEISQNFLRDFFYIFTSHQIKLYENSLQHFMHSLRSGNDYFQGK